jgi:hypothetical protein
MALITSSLTVLCATALLVCAEIAGAQQGQRSPPGRRPGSGDAELVRLRAEVIEKMKEARGSARKLLELNDREQARLRAEYEKRLELFSEGLISRSEVIQIEAALADAIARVEQDRRWLMETDSAIAEATMRDELLRLPRLALGGYSESATLLRFHGTGTWTLAHAPNIERFFLQTFGRVLPVSALGQTLTHDRLRFDHRDAMDVALHPESMEGKALLKYLRQAGIPFIAFKGAVPGASTGAHIHIGPPSPRGSIGFIPVEQN